MMGVRSSFGRFLVEEDVEGGAPLLVVGIVVVDVEAVCLIAGSLVGLFFFCSPALAGLEMVVVEGEEEEGAAAAAAAAVLVVVTALSTVVALVVVLDDDDGGGRGGGDDGCCDDDNTAETLRFLRTVMPAGRATPLVEEGGGEPPLFLLSTPFLFIPWAVCAAAAAPLFFFSITARFWSSKPAGDKAEEARLFTAAVAAAAIVPFLHLVRVLVCPP
mmetsp:Transcript_5876/g.8078  ORF Transcript_5876/g.8078 Transcript_5876/m.8078 type:complete len:216 (-) Transcript_5876:108-755(-)